MPYTTQQMVIDFHKQCKLSIGDPTKPDITVDQDLRLELIREELVDLVEALEAGDIIKTADALGDLQYVINGAAVSWGIDLGPIFEEIHRSNMTKKAANMRSDGKILKDADYSPPDIKRVMRESANEFKRLFVEGDDEGWPLPQEKPSPEVSRKIMETAQDFVSRHHLPGELAEKILIESGEEKIYVHPWGDPRNNWEGKGDFIDEEPTKPNKIKGQLTPYGAFIFSCECGRTHAISFKLGSRGGMAESGTAECICGKAFVAKFNSGDPAVEVMTIEELRKAHA
jgi:hypothetical protein